MAMIRVEVVLTEQQMAEEFIHNLRRHRLPERFFYWFPLSVRAWLELCQDGAYRNFVRSYNLIEHTARELMQQLPSPVELVSLGCGQGDKDLKLLQVARAARRDITYHPVDASQALLEIACHTALEAGVDCLGLKLDLENATHWKVLARRERPRLYIVLGNTLGAFDPPAFLARLRGLLQPEDRVLLDGEIFAPESIGGYDNPTNRQFAFAPLKSVGIAEADGTLRFQTHVDERLPGLNYVGKHFEPGRDLEIIIAGERLRLQRGERLEMSRSYKYSREGFIGLLRETGGLEILHEYQSEDRRFLMVLGRPV
jgi:uncharacterized SAM-dependent methyltransferase